MITTQVGPKPADFSDVRTTNLAVVLHYVRRNAPCSRADIAAATGLNKATVSSLIAELIGRRLIRETGLAEKRIGRPATLLVVDGTAYAALGLSVEVDTLTLVAIDLAGQHVISWRRVFDGRQVAPKYAAAAIAELTKRALGRLAAEQRRVLGLTVAVPGLVAHSGQVLAAADLGWSEVDLAEPVQYALRRHGVTVTVENNANVAAIAEYRYGPQPPAPNLVLLTGGAGIGAGIIVEGKLVRGGLGVAGEIGHLPVDPTGPACPRGHAGCVEALAGPAAIVRRLLPDHLCGIPDPIDLQPEVEDVARRARNGELAPLAVLTAAGRAIGNVAATFANLINPQVVVLGGYLKTLAPWLLPAAQAELANRSIAPNSGGCRVVASVLSHTAAAIGAASKLLDTVDSGHLPTPSGD